MAVTYDDAKRDWTWKERGLDFADVEVVFAGLTYSAEDDRRDYGEVRVITAGFLGSRMVIVGWTQRAADRHIFSMRKANEREKKRYTNQLR